MKGNIKLELKSLTPLRLTQLMGHVATQMDGNVHFPSPPIAPTDLRVLNELLGSAISEATEGSRQSKLQRDSLVAKCSTHLRMLADYVRMCSQGDVAVLASSGFELARVSGPPQLMRTPFMKTARMSGRRGEVELRWSGVSNRRTYHIYVTDQDPLNGAAWTLSGITGRINHRITDLQPYKAYWFCVSAVGALGEGARSNPVLGRAA